jgi:hypothetical protein
MRWAGRVTIGSRCALGSIGLARCCPTYGSTSKTFGLRAPRGGRRSSPSGWPTATLANGDPYVNPGVHIISIRWGKAYALDVSEDSQAVATGLAKQAQAGIEEAAAPKIES